jgi:hypothetical protein
LSGNSIGHKLLMIVGNIPHTKNGVKNKRDKNSPLENKSCCSPAGIFISL